MSKIQRKQNFINNANKKHNNKYDYSLVDYINNTIPVIIICPKHGQLKQIPKEHLKRNGCSKCGREKQNVNRTRTQDQFIEKAKNLHGTKYDYSKVKYVKSNIPIEIICPIHNSFFLKPVAHLQKRGCQKCGKMREIEKRTCNTDQFIEKARKIHGLKYDYSLTDYKKNDTDIIIICPIHGQFKQKPTCHLNGECIKCGINKRAKSKTFSTEKFIEIAKKVHGNDKYDYSETIYEKSKKKVIIICNKKRHKFLQIPNSHLNGRGCVKCSYEERGENQLLTTEEFINRSKKLHGDKFDYSKIIYKDYMSKVEIICKIHGTFLQSPSNHLSSFNGCKKCLHVGFSQISNEWINYLQITYPNLQYYHSKNGEFKIPNTNYHVDGYNIETKTIFEFHGDYWHGNPKLYDKDKLNKTCKKTHGELYQKTINKMNKCKELGYNYVSIWENNWIKGKKVLEKIQTKFIRRKKIREFPFVCKKCNFKTKTKSHYEAHCETEKHKTGKRKIRTDKKNKLCPHCKLYEASNNTNLLNHILINHKTKEEREKEYPNYCKLCDFGTFSKKVYDNHIKSKKHERKLILSKNIDEN